jgi:hypothetical protein
MVILIPFRQTGGHKLDKAAPDSFHILFNSSVINVPFSLRCMFFSTDIVVQCHVVKDKGELQNSRTVSSACFLRIFAAFL